MCCRYYYADQEIHPSDMATIITGRDAGLEYEEMRWGFVNAQTKQLLINARAESALEKKTFSESILRRRCIIPANHFFEWDKEKTKNTFSLEHDPVLFMAGFYNRIQNEDRFIILTTEANASMRPVHDRMPLILGQDEIEDWIHRDEMVKELLRKPSPMLVRKAEYEQMSLW